MNALEVAGLKKNYAGFSLNVSFALEEGKITGFIGRNGAGKTTTIQSLLGFVHPDAGDIRFFSMPFAENEMKIKSRLGVVLGGVNYYPQKRLGTVAAVTSRFYPEWDDSLYRKYMQLFSLDESKRISELSAGMKVKFSLALALSHSADLLILDEPTAGLDPEGCRRILSNICEYREKTGSTVIIVSHSMEDVAKLADRLVVFNGGHIEFDGTPEEVFSHPEELKAIGLAVPAATELSMALRRRGIALSPSIYTISRLLEELNALTGGGAEC